MIGRRSNLKWFARLGGAALLSASASAAENPYELSWTAVAFTEPPARSVMAVAPSTDPVQQAMQLAYPADEDWVVWPSVAVSESHAERWAGSEEPEIIHTAEVRDVEPVAAAELPPMAFPAADWVDVDAALKPAQEMDQSFAITGWPESEAEPEATPWDDTEFFGPVAVLDEVVPEEDEAEEAVELDIEDGLPVDPLLSEDFLIAEQVLEDAANTEYLEDLGLAATAPSDSYDAVTQEIVETGLALLDGDQPKPQNAEHQFDYTEVAPAQEAPTLTLDDILELALSNNPQVGAALAREEQAQWQFREAQVYKYPTIDVIAEGGPEYNRPATNTSGNEDITPGRTMTFRVTQLLYDGGVSLNESDRRLQVRRSTELETRLIVEEIVVKTADFYSQVLQHQRSAAVALEFVEEMQRIVDKLEVMYESGAASKLELDFAKARLASARAETGNTQAELNDALSNLEFLTGELPDFTAVPPRDIHALNVKNLAEYIDVAREQNAELLLNRSNRRSLRYKIRAQRAQYHPILSLNMKSESLADEGGNLPGRNTTELKLKAEYFLFDGGARKARLNRTRAQLKELDFEDDRLVLEVDRQVKTAYNQITTNWLTLDATEDEIASNRELRRLNRQNLEEGEISIIELIEAEERLFNSQATWFRVSSEMFSNYYELQVSAGELASLVGSEHTQTRIEEKPVSPELKPRTP